MIDYLEPAWAVGATLPGWGPFLGLMAGFGVFLYFYHTL